MKSFNKYFNILHINAIKSIFTDKRFLSLGFGGTVNGRTSHCFPLNGNSRDPYCYGIEGIIDAYYSSLEHGKLMRIYD